MSALALILNRALFRAVMGTGALVAGLYGLGWYQ